MLKATRQDSHVLVVGMSMRPTQNPAGTFQAHNVHAFFVGLP